MKKMVAPKMTPFADYFDEEEEGAEEWRRGLINDHQELYTLI